MALADRLRKRIETDGAMPWPAWMEAALYDPGEGYYTRPGRKTGPGADADFATSPTLHPFLARCIAEEAVETWRRLGAPADFAVYEFGGGEGDLARDALAHLDAEHPELAGRIAWNHIERSPTHREAQASGADARIQWLESLPAGAVGFIVAHEFLDALPFWWLERIETEWTALHVGLDGNDFALESGPCPPEVAAMAPVLAPAGSRVAIMHEAKAWLETIQQNLASGAVLVIDYGGNQVWRRDPDGTVRTFARHQDAGPAWMEPGHKDITASVDFAQIRAWADAAGLRLAFEESQEAFLMRHNVLEALNAIDRNTVEGASAYLRLRQMLLPAAMGHAFRVARWDV